MWKRPFYSDQVLEMSGWVVGRTGETFVALYSARPTFWAGEESPYQVTIYDPDPFESIMQGRDLIANGRQNVWICHVTDQSSSGSFQQFAEMVFASQPEVD